MSAPLQERLRELGGLYPWTPRRLTLAGGVSLSYLDEGPREAPPLLFLHGNPTWSFLWRELVRALAPTWRCVAVDHVGAGLSDKPQDYPYTLDTHVKNVEALVAELDLRGLTVIGHDWGGAIACGFATRHPERVARLVLMNTAAFRSERIPFSIDLCRVPGLGALLIRGLNGFTRAALFRAVERPLAPEVQRGYLLPVGSWAERVGQLRFVQDIPLHEGIPSWSALLEIEERLPLLADKPLLLVWGLRDWCFTPDFLAEFRRRFPRAEVLELPAAGHWVTEDAGPQVLERLRAFLAATPVSAPAEAAP